jgi:hypothetical protein
MYARNGKALTSEELAEIAVEAGLIEREKVESVIAWTHNENLIRSHFAQMTMDVCWAMWGRGELDMLPPTNYVAPDKSSIDWELYEWLKARKEDA